MIIENLQPVGKEMVLEVDEPTVTEPPTILGSILTTRTTHFQIQELLGEETPVLSIGELEYDLVLDNQLNI